MRLKRTLTQIAVIGGLAAMNAGLLPAPMCPNCKTPGDWNTYISTVGQSQPAPNPLMGLLLIYLSFL
jgi:hypothetical protein